MNEADLTISGVAKAAGVGVETVRYYERRGLLRQPERRAGSFRRYGTAHVMRMRFARRAQQLGFTLDEVASLLELEDGASRHAAQRIASERLAQIQERLRDLRRMERTLSHLLEECRAGAGFKCPIIEALGDERPAAPTQPATSKRRVAALGAARARAK